MANNVVQIPKRISFVQKQIADIQKHNEDQGIDCLVAVFSFKNEEGDIFYAFSYSDRPLEEQNWLIDKLKQDLLED